MASKPGDPFLDLPRPLEWGTIDPNIIHHRVKNEDGSISTVRTMSFNDGKGEILIPTVVGDRVVSNDEAIKNYYNTGESFGRFKTVEEADRWADYIHNLHQQKLSREGH